MWTMLLENLILKQTSMATQLEAFKRTLHFL